MRGWSSCGIPAAPHPRQQGPHVKAARQRTAEIVRLETQLNARVYDLFDLTAAEIKLIEESTKYRYGEV